MIVISGGKLRVSNGISRMYSPCPVSGGFRTFGFRIVGITSKGSVSRLETTFSRTGTAGKVPATVVVGAMGKGNISFVRGRIK